MKNQAGWRRSGTRGGPMVVVLYSHRIQPEDAYSLCDRLAADGYDIWCSATGSMEGLGKVPGDGGGRFAVIAMGDALQGARAMAGHAACAGLIAFEPPETASAMGLVNEVSVPVCLHVAGAPAPKSVAGDRLRVYSYPVNQEGYILPSSHAFDEFSGRIAYSRTLAFLKWVIGPRPDLAALFREHLRLEFEARDPDGTMETMVEEPYVNHIPTMSGGTGHNELKRFYKYHFIPSTPRNRRTIILNEIVGADAVVLEAINCFTHDQPYDHFLPGLPPTGKTVEIPFVAIAKFKGEKLYFEHIYWDQASVLVQLGLLDPTGLPVTGKQQADKAKHPDRYPSNGLMTSWMASEGRPL